MIVIKDGRSRSIRTAEETQQQLQNDLAQLTPEERATLEVILKEMEEGVPDEQKSIVDTFAELEYREPPVDMETFVKDPYYLGETCRNIYPVLLDDLTELFRGEYFEVVAGGGIGSGKCLSKNTYLTDLESGERHPIHHFVGKTPLVPSLAENGSIVAGRAAKVWLSGVKECLCLTLTSDHKLEASADHPVLTPTGYRPLNSLRPGDFVATSRTAPEPTEPICVSDSEVITAACLIADGSLTTGCVYTKGNLDLVTTFKRHVIEAPGFAGFGFEVFQDGAWYVRPNGLLPWIRELGINCLSKEKRVPPKYFGLAKSQLAQFLAYLFTDSSVYLGKKGSSHRIELQLASEGLIDDARELLTRFGIMTRKCFSPKSAVKDGPKYDAWKLSISDASNILKFFQHIGPIPSQEDKCAQLAQQARDVIPNPNCDVVSVGKYARFASMDVVWERVRSITSTGKQEVYDLTVPGTANAVANGVVVHNTTFASIGVCRMLYELSCLHNPQATYKLIPGTIMSIVAFSVNADLAAKVAYENIIQKLQLSPYFKDKFPFEATKKEIRFPNNIWLAPRATTDGAALGLNIYGAFLDEANFLDVIKRRDGTIESEAEIIYNRLRQRIKSRFERDGKIPGKLFLVSSKQTNEDFTEKLIRRSINDPKVFCIDYSIWDVKPEAYSAEKFQVLCGTAETSSRILTPEEAIMLRPNPPEGTVIIDVPETFRNEFTIDLENSIRDLAGIATPSVRPFIQRREKIRDAIDRTRSHPFSTESYDMSKGGTFLWNQMVAMHKERAPGRVEFERQLPIINPRAGRAAHIDIGLTKDCLGLSLVHIGGWKQVIRRTDDGREFTEQAPIYIVDLVLQVVPPLGGEIVLAEVRHLVYSLIEHGYMITSVTLDSHQSADSLQQFAAKGLNSSLLSVDLTPEPYDTLKTALYEDRIKFYEYAPLIRELTHLQEVFKGAKRKIDHPKQGVGKDVADALAGAVFALSRQRLVQPLPMMRGVSYVADDAWMPEQRQALMAGNPGAARATTLPIPFLTGDSGTGFDNWNDPNDPWGSGNF